MCEIYSVYKLLYIDYFIPGSKSWSYHYTITANLTQAYIIWYLPQLKSRYAIRSNKFTNADEYNFPKPIKIHSTTQRAICYRIRITGSDNWATDMESLAHDVDSTHRLCCSNKSKTLSNNYFKKPWISEEIISNIKKIQHYFALYCQSKIPKDFYTHFRNFVTGQIWLSKKDYYEHKFNAAKRDIKRTFRIINNIINRKNRKVKNT